MEGIHKPLWFQVPSIPGINFCVYRAGGARVNAISCGSTYSARAQPIALRSPISSLGGFRSFVRSWAIYGALAAWRGDRMSAGCVLKFSVSLSKAFWGACASFRDELSQIDHWKPCAHPCKQAQQTSKLWSLICWVLFWLIDFVYLRRSNRCNPPKNTHQTCRQTLHALHYWGGRRPT